MPEPKEASRWISGDKVYIPVTAALTGLVVAFAQGILFESERSKAVQQVQAIGTRFEKFQTEVTFELRGLRGDLGDVSQQLKDLDSGNLKRAEFNAWVREAQAANRGKDVVFPDAPK